jgi:hypothetical protein
MALITCNTYCSYNGCCFHGLTTVCKVQYVCLYSLLIDLLTYVRNSSPCTTICFKAGYHKHHENCKTRLTQFDQLQFNLENVHTHTMNISIHAFITSLTKTHSTHLLIAVKFIQYNKQVWLLTRSNALTGTQKVSLQIRSVIWQVADIFNTVLTQSLYSAHLKEAKNVGQRMANNRRSNRKQNENWTERKEWKKYLKLNRISDIKVNKLGNVRIAQQLWRVPLLIASRRI